MTPCVALWAAVLSYEYPARPCSEKLGGRFFRDPHGEAAIDPRAAPSGVLAAAEIGRPWEAAVLRDEALAPASEEVQLMDDHIKEK